MESLKPLKYFTYLNELRTEFSTVLEDIFNLDFSKGNASHEQELTTDDYEIPVIDKSKDSMWKFNLKPTTEMEEFLLKNTELINTKTLLSYPYLFQSFLKKSFADYINLELYNLALTLGNLFEYIIYRKYQTGIFMDIEHVNFLESLESKFNELSLSLTVNSLASSSSSSVKHNMSGLVKLYRDLDNVKLVHTNNFNKNNRPPIDETWKDRFHEKTNNLFKNLDYLKADLFVNGSVFTSIFFDTEFNDIDVAIKVSDVDKFKKLYKRLKLLWKDQIESVVDDKKLTRKVLKMKTGQVVDVFCIYNEDLSMNRFHGSMVRGYVNVKEMKAYVTADFIFTYLTNIVTNTRWYSKSCNRYDEFLEKYCDRGFGFYSIDKVKALITKPELQETFTFAEVTNNVDNMFEQLKCLGFKQE